MSEIQKVFMERINIVGFELKSVSLESWRSELFNGTKRDKRAVKDVHYIAMFIRL